MHQKHEHAQAGTPFLKEGSCRTPGGGNTQALCGTLAGTVVTQGRTPVVPLYNFYQRQADRLHRRALADLKGKKYRSAYKKIRRAAELNPFSGTLAQDRQRVAARYRDHLAACQYVLLVPWLPFIHYIRCLSSQEAVLLFTWLASAFVIGMAVWLHRQKEKVC